MRDVVTDIKYTFPVNRWLSSTRGDCVTSVTVALDAPVPVPIPRTNLALPDDIFAARKADKVTLARANLYLAIIYA